MMSVSLHTQTGWPILPIQVLNSRVSGLLLALIHKHVKISVDEWIMETTPPHKQVQIPENQIFLASLCLEWSFPTYILFETIEHFRLK